MKIINAIKEFIFWVFVSLIIYAVAFVFYHILNEWE